MIKLSKSTDEEIVQITRESDKEYYSEIINRYQGKLFRYATFITSDEQLAADAVQQGFIKAYINLNGFNIKKKFSSWIYRIVHNEAINLLGKAKNQIPMGETIEFDSGVSLEDEYIKNELINKTHNCLEEMPLLYKEPLSLYYLDEKTYEEIGDILRIPTSTVGTRISRAKLIMKKICQKKSK